MSEEAKGQAKIAGQELKGLQNEDEDVEFLGRLFWYTIGETLAPTEEITPYILDNNLNQKLTPSRPKKKVAWRRATREMEKKIIISEEGEREETEDFLISFLERNEIPVDVKSDEERYIAEYLVRKVDKDTKHLVREVRRPDEGRLDYTELIEWNYINDGDEVTWKPLNKEVKHSELKQMNDKMLEKLQKYKKSASQYEIRKRVKAVLDDKSIITLKSAGGVYFIPEENHEVIEDIKELLDEINEWSTGGYQSSLWQVPVINNEDQRDLIENGIREETVKFASKRIEEIKEILSEDEEITQKKYNNLIEELKEVEKRKEEYESIIDRNLDVCDEQMDIMKKQVRKLAGNVKKGEPKKLSSFEED